MIYATLVAVSLPGVWIAWALLRVPPVTSLIGRAIPDKRTDQPQYFHLGDDWRGMT